MNSLVQAIKHDFNDFARFTLRMQFPKGPIERNLLSLKLHHLHKQINALEVGKQLTDDLSQKITQIYIHELTKINKKLGRSITEQRINFLLPFFSFYPTYELLVDAIHQLGISLIGEKKLSKNKSNETSHEMTELNSFSQKIILYTQDSLKYDNLASALRFLLVLKQEDAQLLKHPQVKQLSEFFLQKFETRFFSIEHAQEIAEKKPQLQQKMDQIELYLTSNCLVNAMGYFNQVFYTLKNDELVFFKSTKQKILSAIYRALSLS